MIAALNLELDGLHSFKNWLLFVRNKQIIYGFRIKPNNKSVNSQQRKLEIKEILKQTDALCGNKTGNEFIKTQINYDGKLK